MAQVLIIGGSGRIGSSIAQDILKHTSADVVLAGRNSRTGEAAIAQLGSRATFQVLDLANLDQTRQAIAGSNLVILTAGPFYTRDTQVLQTCIQQQVNYLDVSDERGFTQRALSLHKAAETAGITAIVNTGVFPGISNSMARQGVEQLDTADSIHLSYVVAGSGGAGVTVMRTTFMGLQRPFLAWLEGQWQSIKPYTGREKVQFPAPYGHAHVYWYDMPEALTLPTSFPVKQVITKFGILPDFYNHLTWMAAHGLPRSFLQRSSTVEFMAQISHKMTRVTDKFSGTGVAIQCKVEGQKAGRATCFSASYMHESATVATGYGTGGLAQLLLEAKLCQPGIWAVEQILPTALFKQIMLQRQQSIVEQLF
jgi:saccharopine dehydrogenase-like NADP-dependent oxidoreductase